MNGIKPIENNETWGSIRAKLNELIAGHGSGDVSESITDMRGGGLAKNALGDNGVLSINDLIVELLGIAAGAYVVVMNKIATENGETEKTTQNPYDDLIDFDYVVSEVFARHYLAAPTYGNLGLNPSSSRIYIVLPYAPSPIDIIPAYKKWTIEVSTDGETWIDTGVDEMEDDKDHHQLSASIENLKPESEYHVRLTSNQPVFLAAWSKLGPVQRCRFPTDRITNRMMCQVTDKVMGRNYRRIRVNQLNRNITLWQTSSNSTQKSRNGRAGSQTIRQIPAARRCAA